MRIISNKMRISFLILLIKFNSLINLNYGHNNNNYNVFGLVKYKTDILKMVNNKPFDFPFDLLKMQNVQVVNETEIMYYLFNKSHPLSNYSIDINTFNGINKKLKIKMLIHGWTEHCHVQWCKDLTRAYVKMGNFNIIVIDWSVYGDADYMRASMTVPAVGDKVGDFLIRMHEKLKVPYEYMHLISHSLGCQVASYVGKRVYNVTGKKLARITALDPAAPIFSVPLVGEEHRLNKNDANVVDITHTDGGVLGFENSIGTIDFYPNGGKAIQPGCSLLKPDVQYEDLFCSHARSHRYYLRSVYNNKITATPCKTWSKYAKGDCKSNKRIIFGAWTSGKGKGNYYLDLEVPTNATY